MEPVLYLRRSYYLDETIIRKTVKANDRKYFCLVFKTTLGDYTWFYQDYEDPHNFHDIASGFSTAEEAEEDLNYTLGVE